ncbi:hypothetical protein, partial [Rhizobium leguminosarum]|uniref:hypothetical protein n=1 Tax=Rhizobium leguminosarum TaxID=384 RepID=UPI00195404EB
SPGDAGGDLVAEVVVRFREDQERRSVFGCRCVRTLAGTLRSERSSLLRADIAVVRKADAMRTTMREFKKNLGHWGRSFQLRSAAVPAAALVKEICACPLGGGRFDFRNRLSTSR